METSSSDLSGLSRTLVPNREGSAPSPSPGQPLLEHEATNIRIDAKTVHDIEQRLRSFGPLLKQNSKRRAVTGLALESTGSALTNSGGVSSTANLGATSTTFARLSAHLDDIIQGLETSPRDALDFAGYLEKLQGIPVHRFESEELKDFKGDRTQHEWALIKHAASASQQAYEEEPDINAGQMFKAKGSRKAMIAYVDQVEGRDILLVAVRGTVTKSDWMLNVNNAPKQSNDLLPKNALWHGGFLTVAQAMATQTAKAIDDIKGRHNSLNEISFTGHSAGGAIAQLFYAMSLTRGTKLSEAVSVFEGVNCVTFGTPPIASIQLRGTPGLVIRPGAFFSIVNEGDPVPQAQEEFIKTLIDVYILSSNDLSQRYPEGVRVPRGQFRASGNLVILRDDEPDDENADNIKAYTTESHLLERKVFGNPFVHDMKEYLERIERLDESQTV